METTELKVDGMTCNSCVASVTKALRRVPGVHGVEVDLRSGVARVTVDQGQTREAAMLAALSDAGYAASSAAAPAAPTAPARRAGGCHGGDSSRGGGCCCR